MGRSDDLSSRVAHAYYKYGCFCSSHPFSALIFSLSSLLFLSYPLTRWHTLSPSTFSCTVSDLADLRVNVNSSQRTAAVHKPVAYVQQVIVTAVVDRSIYVSRTARSEAIRAFLCRLSALKNKVRHFRSSSLSSGSGKTLQDVCLSRNRSIILLDNAHLMADQPHDVLSPLNLWYDNLQNMLDDDRLFETMFESNLHSACLRDVLLGAPRAFLKAFDNCSGGGRCTWRLGLTLLMSELDGQFLTSLRRYIATLQDYEVVSHSHGLSTNQVMNVHYKSGKTLLDYVPLFLAYVLLFVYLYFSARKIEMVKSRSALAVGAVLTDAFSLSMASGICLHFQLTSKLGVAGLFPYLAMLVGMENTLCITRAVVSTPVTLNVKERIAHGLSKEGWSITKNFLVQIAVLTIGFFTSISEIIEFCSFACISYVVDFYMQLFFYVPCLAFDLRRFDPHEKEQLSLLQLTMSPMKLERYPPVRCPFADIFPSLFSAPADSNHPSPPPNIHDRTKSEDKPSALTSPAPARVELNIQSYPSVFNRISHPLNLRALFRWARERYFHRIALAVTVMWIVWFVFLVNQWQLVCQIKGIFSQDWSGVMNERQHSANASLNSALKTDVFDHNQVTSGTTDDHGSEGVSYEDLDMSSYQAQLIPCWLHVFDLRGATATGDHNRFIAVLSPILLRASINKHNVDDPCGTKEVAGPIPSTVMSLLTNDQMHLRISWLEVQMTIVLFLSCSIFVTVFLFILYVCFVGGSGAQSLFSLTKDDQQPPSRYEVAGADQSIVASLPVVFRGHGADVEQLVVVNSGCLVSCSISGDIVAWDPKADECLFRISPDRGLHDATQGLTPSSSLGGDGTVRNRRLASTTRRCEMENADNSTSPLVPLLLAADGDKPFTNVWSLSTNGSVLAVGLSNGYVDFFNTETGSLTCCYRSCGSGVTQVVISGSRVFAARLDGHLDFLELRPCTELLPMKPRPLTGADPLLQQQQRAAVSRRFRVCCSLVKTFAAHQQPINCLKVCANSAVTASDDFTLKMYDIARCRLSHTLYGHGTPVISVLIDDDMQSVYSCSDDSVICVWDLLDGGLLRTIRDVAMSAAPLTLGLTNVLLIGLAFDSSLWVWKKSSAELITRIKPASAEPYSLLRLERPQMTILNDNVAVTACHSTVQFWDLKSKMMVREVRLADDEHDDGRAVTNLIAIDDTSIACTKDSLVFMVAFPMARF